MKLPRVNRCKKFTEAAFQPSVIANLPPFTTINFPSNRPRNTVATILVVVVCHLHSVRTTDGDGSVMTPYLFAAREGISTFPSADASAPAEQTSH
jgi:hypothetical protein